MLKCAEYCSKFLPLEATRHELLSDKMAFHFYELPKLPVDIRKDNMLLLWLSLFKAETEEELEIIKAMEVPVMSQAINAYYSITASSELREMERLRIRASHDEAQALHNKAREIARNALLKKMPINDIIDITGLTREDVEGLASGMPRPTGCL